MISAGLLCDLVVTNQRICKIEYELLQLILTDDHLYLIFGKEPRDKYFVDLTVNQHKFFVRYLDADTPLIASYLPNGRIEDAIEIETCVIDELQRLNFIRKVEIYDEEAESSRPHNHPQDCLVTIDISTKGTAL